ncbi:MAG: MT-A70 family methyltransferase [Pararhizobium sp.]
MIVADPNWQYKAYSEKGQARAPERHYKTSPLTDICSIPVREVAGKDSHLALWITGPHIVLGWHVSVMQAWGFEPSSMGFVWVKPKKGSASVKRPLGPVSVEDFVLGLGHTTRQNAEFVILGRRGRPRRYSKSIHQLIVEPRREHSRKPEAFYTAIEEYAGHGSSKLEMFARQQRRGWTVWGDQTTKFGGAPTAQREKNEPAA